MAHHGQRFRINVAREEIVDCGHAFLAGSACRCAPTLGARQRRDGQACAARQQCSWDAHCPMLPRTRHPGKLQAEASARDITKKAHRLVLQVNTNEPATMNLALNNATNVEQHYKSLGEKIEI